MLSMTMTMMATAEMLFLCERGFCECKLKRNETTEKREFVRRRTKKNDWISWRWLLTRVDDDDGMRLNKLASLSSIEMNAWRCFACDNAQMMMTRTRRANGFVWVRVHRHRHRHVGVYAVVIQVTFEIWILSANQSFDFVAFASWLVCRRHRYGCCWMMRAFMCILIFDVDKHWTKTDDKATTRFWWSERPVCVGRNCVRNVWTQPKSDRLELHAFVGTLRKCRRALSLFNFG